MGFHLGNRVGCVKGLGEGVAGGERGEKSGGV